MGALTLLFYENTVEVIFCDFNLQSPNLMNVHKSHHLIFSPFYA